MKKFFVCLLIVGLTSACGWQLRGSTGGGSSLERLYVTTEDNHGPFITEFLQTLRANKIAVVEDPSQAQLQLVLSEEIRDRRTAAVGSDALTSAFELILTVEYSIHSADGQELVSQDTARVLRTFDYTARSATSSAREENTLLGEMRSELSRLLIRRAEAVAQRQLQAPAGKPHSALPEGLSSPSSRNDPADTDHGQTAP